ncbi:MAG: transaldolase [Solirubrobacterales bacterium]
MNTLRHLHDAGVSIWLDDLSRELLESGEFESLVRECDVTGATSNPTIFAKAIGGSDRYDDQLQAVLASGIRDLQEVFFELALEDVRRAADLLRPVYEATEGRDGFVSFECTPDLADDAESTVEQAIDVRSRLEAPNVLIKVAATDAGIEAIEELTARGVSVNVTLLFSLSRYEQAIGAYLDGLDRRVGGAEPLAGISSVASFFVSRVDAAVDQELAPDSPLRGRIAIANAQRAYARYRGMLEAPRWKRLEALGAQPQRPLWASVGTKDDSYSDVRYVQDLIAPDVISTMPPKTLRAFAGHGDVGGSLGKDAGVAERLIDELAAAGIDFAALTDGLERRGVEAFRDSYHQLMRSIEERIAALTTEAPDAFAGEQAGS